MGVSYIPGPEQILGPALGQLGEAVAKYISPDAQFQKAIKQAIAVNPQLIQHLADMEAKAPGSLMNLGFGNKLTDTITKTPESSEQKFSRENAGAIQQEATSKLQRSIAENKFALEDVIEFGEFKAKNPGAKFEDFMHRATGETKGTRLDTEEKQRSADLAKGIDLKDPKNLDMIDVAKRFLKGDTAAATTVIGMMAAPETNKAMNAIFNQIENDKQRAHQIGMQNERGTAMSNIRLSSAYKMWDQSGNAGQVELWEKYIFESGVKQKAAELSKQDRASLSFEDRQLVDIFNADQTMHLQASEVAVRSARKAVLDNISAFRTAKDKSADKSELDMRIGEINAALETRAALPGGKLVRATYEGEGAWRTTKLRFVDEAGKEVPEADVFGEPTASVTTKKPAAASLEISTRAIAAATDILKLPEELQGPAFEAMVAKDKSPGKINTTAIQQELVRQKKGVKK